MNSTAGSFTAAQLQAKKLSKEVKIPTPTKSRPSSSAPSRSSSPVSFGNELAGYHPKRGDYSFVGGRPGEFACLKCVRIVAGPGHATLTPRGAAMPFVLLQEHDNSAESLIKDTVVYDDDTPILRQLKLTMVEMYNLRLQRR